jgi:asparagine synthase (glutamine-hydrolysing)
LFCGYPRYLAVRLASRIDRLPRFVRSMCAWPVWQKIPASVEQRSLRRRFKRFVAALAQPPEERYLRWIGIFDADWRPRLYTPAFRVQLAGFSSAWFINDVYAACPDRDFITRTTCADVLSYLPCDILTKVDIASMAYSLEARSPFLDHHVAELAARMPLRLKLHGNRGKQVLVDTFRDLLPESIQARGKMGFGVPIDHWFRDELRPLLRDTLLGETATRRGYFKPATVRRLIDEHETRQFDHAYRLWSLLVFEQWCRTFLDCPEVPTVIH